jgi:hypothetical protein
MYALIYAMSLLYFYTSTYGSRLATDWTARGSNPGGGEIFRTRPNQPWGAPSLLYNGYRIFPGGKVVGAWCLYLYSPFGPFVGFYRVTLPLRMGPNIRYPHYISL